MRNLGTIEKIGLAGALVSRMSLMQRRPYWSQQQREAWQLRRLQRMVEHAYESVPFYRTKYDDAGIHPRELRSLSDLSRFPIVTKDEIIANYPHATIASGYDVSRLIVSRSSGSSGKVLDITYDAQAMTTYVLAGLRLLQMGFDYRPWHRQLYIYTSSYPLSSLGGLYPMHFVPTLAPTDAILEQICHVRPHLLVCYPSHLRHLLDEARQRGIELPRPRMVSVNSEMSTQTQRDAMSRELGCPVLDEYSSEELTRIAAQCLHGTYHVFDDINYIETVDAQGVPTPGQGRIVGTNLHNRAMPMIRYLQDDLGTITHGSCPCGRTFRHLTSLHGRANDSFTLPSGRTITSGFLLDAAYDVVLSFRTAVRDFCLIQETASTIVLEVVPGTGWTPQIERELVRRFDAYFEPAVAFRVACVSECRKTRTGKRNPIINLCRPTRAATPACTAH